MSKRKNINQHYQQKFYQVPQVLFTNPKYMDKKLGLDAKMAYGILLNRLQLSINNNWFDKNGDIYFIYTGEQLEKILGVGHTTVTKIKNTLVEFGLLEMKRTGSANLMYLLEPEITPETIKNIQNDENEVLENPDMSTSIDPITVFQQSDYRNTVTSNTDLSNTEFITRNTDTLSTDTLKAEKNSNNQTPKISEKNTSDFETAKNIFGDIFETNMPRIELISNASNLTTTEIKKIIMNAKNKAFKDNSLSSRLMDLKNMTYTLDTTLNAIGTNVFKKQTVDFSKLDGYIFNAFYYNFSTIASMYGELSNANMLEPMIEYTDRQILFDFDYNDVLDNLRNQWQERNL